MKARAVVKRSSTINVASGSLHELKRQRAVLGPGGQPADLLLQMAPTLDDFNTKDVGIDFLAQSFAKQSQLAQSNQQLRPGSGPARVAVHFQQQLHEPSRSRSGSQLAADDNPHLAQAISGNNLNLSLNLNASQQHQIAGITRTRNHNTSNIHSNSNNNSINNSNSSVSSATTTTINGSKMPQANSSRQNMKWHLKSSSQGAVQKPGPDSQILANRNQNQNQLHPNQRATGTTRHRQQSSEQADGNESDLEQANCWQVMKKLLHSLLLGSLIALCWMIIIHTLKWVAMKGNELDMALNQNQNQNQPYPSASGLHASYQQLALHHDPSQALYYASLGAHLDPGPDDSLGNSSRYTNSNDNNNNNNNISNDQLIRSHLQLGPQLKTLTDPVQLNGSLQASDADDSSNSASLHRPSPAKLTSLLAINSLSPSPSRSHENQNSQFHQEPARSSQAVGPTSADQARLRNQSSGRTRSRTRSRSLLDAAGSDPSGSLSGLVSRLARHTSDSSKQEMRMPKGDTNSVISSGRASEPLPVPSELSATSSSTTSNPFSTDEPSLDGLDSDSVMDSSQPEESSSGGGGLDGSVISTTGVIVQPEVSTLATTTIAPMLNSNDSPPMLTSSGQMMTMDGSVGEDLIN